MALQKGLRDSICSSGLDWMASFAALAPRGFKLRKETLTPIYGTNQNFMTELRLAMEQVNIPLMQLQVFWPA